MEYPATACGKPGIIRLNGLLAKSLCLAVRLGLRTYPADRHQLTSARGGPGGAAPVPPANGAAIDAGSSVARPGPATERDNGRRDAPWARALGRAARHQRCPGWQSAAPPVCRLHRETGWSALKSWIRRAIGP